MSLQVLLHVVVQTSCVQGLGTDLHWKLAAAVVVAVVVVVVAVVVAAAAAAAPADYMKTVEQVHELNLPNVVIDQNAPRQIGTVVKLGTVAGTDIVKVGIVNVDWSPKCDQPVTMSVLAEGAVVMGASEWAV